MTELLIVLLVLSLLAVAGVVVLKLRADAAIRRMEAEKGQAEQFMAQMQHQLHAYGSHVGGLDSELRRTKTEKEQGQQFLAHLQQQLQAWSAHAAAMDAELRRVSAELAARNGQVTTLHQHVQALSKWQGVLDAEAKAASIIADANFTAEAILAKARQEAAALIAQARATEQQAASRATQLRAQAEAEALALRQRADSLVEHATAEATKIIGAANNRAEEIAGEAYAAMRNVKKLEQTARALKNVIEGYGDEYVVPTFGLLDELAEEFGFAEGGQKLKAARAIVRQMIKDGTAATCNYVEQNRRTTAVAFVLDAFNGKVDSILSGVRDDNYGTLEQKVRDAFTIVNKNGEAFKNARITDAYLAARLDELRWAVVAQELKVKEREEQRLIKERIREEEKAKREYERAINEAAKEEGLLRKATEKARAEFEKASDEQKALYEDQLRQLEERLTAAEEKNKRALSMAQQTKAGHVYVISNVGSFGEHVHKIGMTRRLEPLERVKELGDASVPFDFDVHALVYADDAPALEHELHRRFLRAQVNKVNPRKEFFRVPVEQIRHELDQLGCQTTWTMAAACAQYKETLAIERAMTDKTFAEAAWEASQVKEHDVSLLDTPAPASVE
jgi:hypothetical protein